MGKLLSPTPSSGRDARIEEKPSGGGQARVAAPVATAFLAFLGGLLIGPYCLPQRDSGEKGWQYTTPDVPADVSPQYRERCEEARKAVTQAMNAAPNSASAVAAMAVFCYLAHDPDNESRCWERCLELEPKHAQAFLRLAMLAEQQGDHQRVVVLMQRALKADPANWQYWTRLGNSLMQLNRFDESRKALEESLRLGARDADTCLSLGKVHEQLKRTDDAERYLEKAAVLEPRRVEALYALTTVCAKAGEAEKAAEYRSQFQRLERVRFENQSDSRTRREMHDDRLIPPRVSEILRLASQVFVDQGDFDTGERYLRRGAEISPDEVDSWKALVAFYDSRGRAEEALRCVRELRRIAPGDPEHLRAEALLCVRLNHVDEAESIFQNFCAREPRSAFGYAGLAELYFRTGRKPAEARLLAEKAVQREPTAWRWAVLAMICERAGDVQAARAAMKEAIVLEPSNQQYQQMYESVNRAK